MPICVISPLMISSTFHPHCNQVRSNMTFLDDATASRRIRAPTAGYYTNALVADFDSKALNPTQEPRHAQ